jgi:hypothetical protein
VRATGTLEEGRGCGEAAPRLRPRCRTFELAGNLLVGRGCGLRAVPGAPVGIAIRVGGFREGAVDLAPLFQTSRSVHRRANEWMPEHQSGRQRQPLLRLKGLRSGLGDPEPLGRSPYERRISHGVGRSQEQQAPSVVWKPRQPSRVALLDAGGQGHRGRQAKSARELRRAQPARQLQQGQRIPVRLGDDPLQHAFVQSSWQDRLEQRPRMTMTQRRHVKLRQTGERVAQLSRREHERDLLRKEPARHKGDGSLRRTVEPLRVIDQAQERLLLGGLGKQAQDRQPHQETIRRWPSTEPERDAQRVVLGVRKALHELEERRAQLLNRREREFHLGLDPERPGDPKLRCGADRVLEKRRLSDARFAVHRQHSAAPSAGPAEQPVEHLGLAFPAEQLSS